MNYKNVKKVALWTFQLCNTHSKVKRTNSTSDSIQPQKTNQKNHGIIGESIKEESDIAKSKSNQQPTTHSQPITMVTSNNKSNLLLILPSMKLLFSFYTTFLFFIAIFRYAQISNHHQQGLGRSCSPREKTAIWGRTQKTYFQCKRKTFWGKSFTLLENQFYFHYPSSLTMALYRSKSKKRMRGGKPKLLEKKSSLKKLEGRTI